MAYDVEAINASATSLEFIRNVNDLTDMTLGHGWAIVIMVLIFIASWGYIRHLGRTLIATGILSFIPSMILLFMGLITWYLMILNLILIVVGIVLSQPRDVG